MPNPRVPGPLETRWSVPVSRSTCAVPSPGSPCPRVFASTTDWWSWAARCRPPPTRGSRPGRPNCNCSPSRWPGRPDSRGVSRRPAAGRAAGARVYPGHGPEIGWGPVELTAAARRDDPLLAGLPACLGVLHWHGDTFDLPPGAHHLARNDALRATGLPRRGHRLGPAVPPRGHGGGRRRLLALPSPGTPRARRVDADAPSRGDPGRRVGGARAVPRHGLRPIRRPGGGPGAAAGDWHLAHGFAEISDSVNSDNSSCLMGQAPAHHRRWSSARHSSPLPRASARSAARAGLTLEQLAQRADLSTPTSPGSSQGSASRRSPR